MFTEQELSNLVGFVETGARSVAASSPLDKAGQVLLIADALVKKLVAKDAESKEASVSAG